MCRVWYYILVKGGGNTPKSTRLQVTQVRKNFLKKFKKPLDNHLPLWYNKNVKRVATYAKPKGKKGNHYDQA